MSINKIPFQVSARLSATPPGLGTGDAPARGARVWRCEVGTNPTRAPSSSQRAGNRFRTPLGSGEGFGVWLCSRLALAAPEAAGLVLCTWTGSAVLMALHGHIPSIPCPFPAVTRCQDSGEEATGTAGCRGLSPFRAASAASPPSSAGAAAAPHGSMPSISSCQRPQGGDGAEAGGREHEYFTRSGQKPGLFWGRDLWPIRNKE